MKNIKVLIRYSCPACKGTGKITSDKYKSIKPDYTTSSTPIVALYSKTYCPSCRGEGYLEEWVDLSQILKETPQCPN